MAMLANPKPKAKCEAWPGSFLDGFVTPLKFNMEPEKKSLEKEIPFGNHHFQVPC